VVKSQQVQAGRQQVAVVAEAGIEAAEERQVQLAEKAAKGGRCAHVQCKGRQEGA